MKRLQLAMSPANGRWYRVSIQQMRYFPINRLDALELLRTGKATEVLYRPFSRPDLHQAARYVEDAIQRALEGTR
jgi:hypothetical protein